MEEEDECLCSSSSLHHHPSPGFHTSAAVGQASSRTSRQQRRRRIPACLSCLEGGMSSDEKLRSSCLFTSLSRRLDSSQAPDKQGQMASGEKKDNTQTRSPFLSLGPLFISTFLSFFSFIFLWRTKTSSGHTHASRCSVASPMIYGARK